MNGLFFTNLLPWVGLLIIVASLIWVIRSHHKKGRKKAALDAERVERWREWAGHSEFVVHSEIQSKKSILPIKDFELGEPSVNLCVLQKKFEGFDMAIIERRYRPSGGTESVWDWRIQTKCLLKLNKIHVPDFFLRHGGAKTGKVEAWFGMEDGIWFDDEPIFNETFYCTGEEGPLKGLFHPALRRFLIAHKNQFSRVRAINNRVLIDPQRKMAPEEISALFNFSVELYNAFI